MSEATYLKCACSNCAGHIEFPSEGAGLMINCPHCGVRTLLSAPPKGQVQKKAADAPAPAAAAAPTPAATSKAAGAKAAGGSDSLKETGKTCPGCGAAMRAEAKICVQCGHGIKKRRALLVPLAVAAVILAGAGGFFGWKKYGGHSAEKVRQEKPAKMAAVPKPDSEPKTPEPKPVESAPPENPSTPGKPKAPKALSDLKVSAPKLEGAKGSGLVYVVGTVKNASDHQRFGVRVEFELYDRAGNKIATPPSSDYKQILEPREEWNYRAIVLDPKAASAKLSSTKEED